jgi:DNA repair exonuclease SbcCD nuclease subunit
MKLPILSDLHFGLRNDHPSFRDYLKKFYEEQFFPYIDKHAYKEIVHCGDLMDRRKYVNFETLDFMQRVFIDQLQIRGIKCHTILGNHDVYFRNTNRLNSTKLLFGHVPNLIIYEDFTDVTIGGREFSMIPWITADNQDRLKDFVWSSKASIAFAHLELLGYEVMRGVPSDEGIEANLFQRYDSVYSGHFHQKSHGANIWYLGTAYDMTFSDLYETKGFHVLDTDTNTLEFIKNPEKMFHMLVFDENTVPKNFKMETYKDKYVKIILKVARSSVNFEKFLIKLYEAGPIEVDIVDEYMIDQDPAGANIDESWDTLRIVFDQIDNRKDYQDPTALKSMMGELYRESVERGTV